MTPHPPTADHAHIAGRHQYQHHRALAAALTVMDTYGTPAVALVSGQGAHVRDADGRDYLDLVAGIAVNALGHAHPAVIEAVTRQVSTLGHTSNLAINAPSVLLAERLVALTGRPGKVFFCNSGAEAIEAALKISRRTGRTGIVTAEGSFHGRTTGALALTGQPAKREPFAPLIGDLTYVPYGDVGALAAAVGPSTAAVVLEPVQGEGGVLPAPPGHLATAAEIARSAGALLVLDEVQTGIGRTGHWYAHQADSLTPDVVTLAKGLGGDCPSAPASRSDQAAELLTPGHARLDVRRQPDLLRGGSRSPGNDRGAGTPGPGRGARRAHHDRGRVPWAPARRSRTRSGPAARDRPERTSRQGDRGRPATARRARQRHRPRR